MDSQRFRHESSIFTLGAPHEEVQGRQTKLHPGFIMSKLVQPTPGTVSQFFEIPTLFCPNGLNPRSGMRYFNIHCVTGKGFCLKKAEKHILEQWPVLLLQLMKPDPSTHSDMVWGRASHECYPKVMTRSSEGHSKVKSAENG